tara:strand:- start:282 stop:704 length:423 start_codon:yes stop_codon:yes gene_type:complete
MRLHKTDIAYTAFVGVVCLWFSVLLVRAVRYGERLRQLRQLCEQVLRLAETDRLVDIPENDSDIRVLVQKKSTGKVVHHLQRETGEALSINELEVLRIVKESAPLHVIFEHSPDLDIFTHIIALCKTESDEWVVVTCMST